MSCWRHITAASVVSLLVASHCLGGEYLFPPTDFKVNTSPGGAYSSSTARVCSDNSGHVYVFWNEARGGPGATYLRRSEDYGETWSDEIVVGAGSDLECCCDDYGNIYLLYASESDDGNLALYLSRSTDHGRTWLEEGVRVSHAPVFSQGASGARIRCDAQGRVYVAWQEVRFGIFGRSIFFNRSLDRGLTWSEIDSRLDIPGEAENDVFLNGLTSDGQGHVYVLWSELRVDGFVDRIRLARSSDAGATWAAPEPVNQEPGLVVAAQIDCNESGAVYVSWGIDGDDSGIGMNFSLDYGATWSPGDICVTCDEPDTNAVFSRICSDEMGRVYIGYYNSDNGVRDIRVAVSTDHGMTWSPSVDVGSEETFPNDPAIVLACTEAGHVFAAWEDARFGSIYASYSTDYGETWSDEDIRCDWGDGLSSLLRLAHDRWGHFYLVWNDRRDGPLGDVYTYHGNPAVDLRLRSAVEPVVISSSTGGSFVYDASGLNETESTLEQVIFVLDAEVRPGRAKGPLFGPLSLSLPPGARRGKTRMQEIPAGVPPGLYAFRLVAGGEVDDQAVLYVRVVQ